MRKVLQAVGVIVVCAPLALVLFLLAAVYWPTMDSLTRYMPDSVRLGVAASVMHNVPFIKSGVAGVHRVLALDPDNHDAWSRLCMWDSLDASGTSRPTNCEKAVSLDDSATNWDNLGKLQESRGDACLAADSFTKAASKGSSGTYYGYVENLGRASLRCGNNYDARAALGAAIDLEDKSMKDASDDDDEVDDEKSDQQTDREYLIVTLNQLHDAAGAKQACSAVHPDWKGCDCKLDAKGEVACVDTGK